MPTYFEAAPGCSAQDGQCLCPCPALALDAAGAEILTAAMPGGAGAVYPVATTWSVTLMVVLEHALLLLGILSVTATRALPADVRDGVNRREWEKRQALLQQRLQLRKEERQARRQKRRKEREEKRRLEEGKVE